MIADEIKSSLLRSALENEESIYNWSTIMNWLLDIKMCTTTKIEKIDLNSLREWTFADTYSKLIHNSGKFFSIEGINVKTNWGEISEWEQPIINQPEIGYLGFIVKEFNGILHFLMQAKVEPGNINTLQLSPTLQATKSNYLQVHKGKKPDYLEYFAKADSKDIILDQLQSEQGARFLKKRNRNIIIKVDEDIHLLNNFIWVSLRQIKKLLQYSNIVNMDTRTVISGISFFNHRIDVEIAKKTVKGVVNSTNPFFYSAMDFDNALFSIDAIIAFLTRLKCSYDLEITKISLSRIKNWRITEKDISHEDNKFFKVIATNIEISGREVKSWQQPMIEPAQEGIIAIICKKINGVIHFLLQGKLECGNFDIIELAPTVQCLTGNYKQTPKNSLPYLDFVLSAKKEQIILESYQSEEGGRFFREQNKNMILLVGDEFPIETPDNFIWLTLNQINYFMKFNNIFNIQVRSIISMIDLAG